MDEDGTTACSYSDWLKTFAIFYPFPANFARSPAGESPPPRPFGPPLSPARLRREKRNLQTGEVGVS